PFGEPVSFIVEAVVGRVPVMKFLVEEVSAALDHQEMILGFRDVYAEDAVTLDVLVVPARDLCRDEVIQDVRHADGADDLRVTVRDDSQSLEGKVVLMAGADLPVALVE